MTQPRVFSITFSSLRRAALAVTVISLSPALASAGPSASPSASAPTPSAAPTGAAPPAAVPKPNPTPAAAPGAAPTTPATGAAASTTPAAPTPEVKAAADAAIVEGQTAYRAGDYETAVTHFQRAAALVPSASAQYWLATSLDLKGDARGAILGFQTLLENPEFTTLPPDQQDAAKSRLEALEQLPATVALTVKPADAQLLVDGVPQPGVSPFSVKLAPGKHTLRVQRDGHEPIETELEVGPAELLEDNVELTPIAAAAPPPAATPAPAPPPAEPRSKVPAYITLGVAGAGAIVGTIFGIQALGAQKTFDDEPTAAHADDVERNALIADMAFGVAFTLGITGVVLLTSDEPVESAASLEVTPYASKTGGGASARLAF